MICPKCKKEQPDSDACMFCQIIVKKYLKLHPLSNDALDSTPVAEQNNQTTAGDSATIQKSKDVVARYNAFKQSTAVFEAEYAAALEKKRTFHRKLVLLVLLIIASALFIFEFRTAEKETTIIAEKSLVQIDRPARNIAGDRREPVGLGGSESPTNLVPDDITKVPREYWDRAAPALSSLNRFNDESQAVRGSNPTATSQYQDNVERAESWWKGQANRLRQRMKVVQDDLDYYYGLQRDCRESQKNIISTKNRDCDSLYSYNINQREKELEGLRTKLEVELPEEARRAGASPGWLRETQPPETVQTTLTDNSERWWRSRVNNLRAQLRTEQENLNNQNQLEQKCEEEQRYNTGCKWRNCKVMYENQIKYTERKISKLKQTLESDLPEEARRGGVPPGWLRE